MIIKHSYVGAVVLFLSACGVGPALEEGAAVIGPEGGAIAFKDGASIEVPALALNDAVLIEQSRNEAATALPAGKVAVGPYYRFSPQGTIFQVPAIITLPFDPALLVDDSEIVVLTAPDGSADYTALVTEPVDGARVRVFASHFSEFVPTQQPKCRPGEPCVALVTCNGNGSCNDGNPCTFNDKCKNHVCSGTAYSCNDGNVCTNDVCNGSGGCTHPFNTVPCNDGNACTFSDTCSGGACGGTAYSCNDGNVCTNDVCNGSGGCTHPFNTASCNDGNACTFSDTCSGGACGGTAYSCDDSNACTTDACNGLGGCTHSGVGCPSCPVAENCFNGIDDDCDSLVDSNDPDCGGCSISCESDPCPPGYVCGFDGCCVPHCFDGVRNGDEGDVDCGGSCAAKCAPGQHCYGFWDCASGICTNAVCQ